MEKNNMLLVSSIWGKDKKPSFKMIPLTENSPFIEVVFIPDERVLGIITKIPKKIQDWDIAYDENGKPKPIYDDVAGSDGKKKRQIVGYKRVRVTVDSYHEHVLHDPDEIRNIIQMSATNYNAEWILKINKFLEVPEAPPGEVTLADPKTVEKQALKVVE